MQVDRIRTALPIVLGLVVAVSWLTLEGTLPLVITMICGAAIGLAYVLTAERT